MNGWNQVLWLLTLSHYTNIVCGNIQYIYFPASFHAFSDIDFQFLERGSGKLRKYFASLKASSRLCLEVEDKEKSNNKEI